MTGQMTLNETCSCSDYTTSRRSFLRNAAVVSAGAVATTMFGDAFRQASYAATKGNVMVVLSLRGGADGLSIVVPHGDAAYYDARPVIAVPRASLLVRDDMFGLHPGLKPLESMWTAGKFAAVHATGLPQPNRSHFSAIEEIEDANLGSEARTGWINRLIGLTAERSPLEAVTVGSGLLPTSMYGPEQTLATSSTDDISLSGGDDPERMRWRRQALTQVWHGTRSTLGTGARSALKTTATLGPALRVDYAPANGRTIPTATSATPCATPRADQGAGRGRRGSHRLRQLGHAFKSRHASVDRSQQHERHGRQSRDGAWRLLCRPGDAGLAGHPRHADGVRPPGERERRAWTRPRLGQRDTCHGRWSQGRPLLRPGPASPTTPSSTVTSLSRPTTEACCAKS